MAETDATVIPQIRQVFRMAFAELNALIGLRDGALAYGTDTGSLYRQNGDGAANWEVVAAPATPAPGLTITLFQFYPATGTSDQPAFLNDNDTSATSAFDPNEYSEVLWAVPIRIKQFRYYDNGLNSNDGIWKIEYLDIDGVWQDWVTGLSTRGSSWSNWDSSGGEVIAHGIRWTCTTMDSSGNKSLNNEIEVEG